MSGTRKGAPPTLFIRIDLSPERRLGPGKIALLAAIAELGSISGAARRLGMSYSRAWALVEDLNRLFPQKLIHAQSGGRQGGGASLSPSGEKVLNHAAAIEAAIKCHTRRELAALARIGKRRA